MSKIATDLVQSKKLVALGIDSSTADMFYLDNGEDLKLMWELVVDKPKYPAWSLDALLNLIPSPSLHKIFTGWRCDSYNEDGSKIRLGADRDTAIDAAFEMILKLHELKLL